ncbi:hypothetical protein TWF569_000249 [Orbilia oligospora]|nr:hypothetical protein TWF569_000249 [Orbilia oligospora]
MAAGLPPMPKIFFEEGLAKHNSSWNSFSQWSYDRARAEGSCVHENRRNDEYIWAWKIDDPSSGNPLAITTAIRPRAYYSRDSMKKKPSSLVTPSDSMYSSTEITENSQAQNSESSRNPETRLSGRRDPTVLPLAPVRPSIQVSAPTSGSSIAPKAAETCSTQASSLVSAPTRTFERTALLPSPSPYHNRENPTLGSLENRQAITPVATGGKSIARMRPQRLSSHRTRKSQAPVRRIQPARESKSASRQPPPPKALTKKRPRLPRLRRQASPDRSSVIVVQSQAKPLLKTLPFIVVQSPKKPTPAPPPLREEIPKGSDWPPKPDLRITCSSISKDCRPKVVAITRGI